ncbi:MAG: phenylalanine--tRNA ligase subunit beta [Thermoproteus sp. AZ2]|uniref:Phenylalanine--tRNA ligase subunit beta n=1 Tax=Thermoproteus sp. AZ2 TaxID=1609232 RepID=A0ACC6V0D7_9CREN|nr:MAG: phenylalanyl-tRNA synthetase subunit beta [Thermoproteus sp. AZ2]
MPIIDLALWDLERLTGAREQGIMKALDYIKGNLESREGDRLKFEATHDRPDFFSAEGLARAIKGVLGIEAGAPRAEVKAGDVQLIYGERIEERPYALMAIVRGLRLDDEAIAQMIQLQEKLHDTYGRDRRKIAIGFYDLAKIKPPIYYKRVSADDEYVPLGLDRPVKVREMYELTDKGRKYAGLIKREAPPALVDSSGQIMVIIPVLGSECCKVTASTRDVLIDVTGQDPAYISKVMSVLVYSLLERSDAKVVELVKTSGGVVDISPRLLAVRRSDVSALLGVEVGEEEYADLLRRARYDVEGERVVVPPYRINVLSWIDVAEDVAILKGYNKLPREPPPMSTAGRRHRVEASSWGARRALLSLGFYEVMNYVLSPAQLLGAFGLGYAEVLNPASERLNAVRSSLLPGLLDMASRAKRKEVRMFEVGDVFDGETKRAVAFVLAKDGATLTDGLAVLRALCVRLGARCEASNHKAPWCIEGRCAKISGDLSGIIGEVKPEILERIGLLKPTVAAELYL